MPRTKKSAKTAQAPKLDGRAARRATPTPWRVTDDPDSSFARYYRDILQFPLLTREEELAVAKKAEKGNKAAIQKMVVHNLRLVIKIAGDYSHLGCDIQDLISAGNESLFKAAERYRTNHGAKFSTYAAWWIKQGLRRCLSNQSRTVRQPVHILDARYKIARTRRELHRCGISDPDVMTLALESGIAPSKIKKAEKLQDETVSLDKPLDQDEGDTTLKDVIPDEQTPDASENTQQAELISILKQVVHKLPKREQLIISLRFGLGDNNPHTLDEVGKRLQVTRERIRQIEAMALGTLARQFAKLKIIDNVNVDSTLHQKGRLEWKKDQNRRRRIHQTAARQKRTQDALQIRELDNEFLRLRDHKKPKRENSFSANSANHKTRQGTQSPIFKRR